MSLNIKNESVHALVRELAEITGMSQTSAVEDAVRRRLEQLREETPKRRFSPEEEARRRAEIRRIVAQFHEETTPEQREAMSNHGDWLYDELGLPR
ncbi:type II toxin-antitoxin system VapB family antitoxin [Microbacterium hominis]|uniref:Type II toxin-antitoxin system VapB family antitoxin n=1 Tax=Microbacterium hominis TaxID=162426 RepID=A0A7D4PP38_9MICO|nr:type II toxin-antitoxin system VapB family antitoxin [Microbacterium hominis]QKJ20775.1 type II toxin-antitoxin system VapB family antitoxin [Microbacterium hominis]